MWAIVYKDNMEVINKNIQLKNNEQVNDTERVPMRKPTLSLCLFKQFHRAHCIIYLARWIFVTR